MTKDYNFVGELKLKNVINEMNYGTISVEDHGLVFSSISDVFGRIKNRSPKYVALRVVCDKNNIDVQFRGNLREVKDRHGTLSWFVGGYPAEDLLFELVGQNVKIFIRHYMGDSD